MDPAANIARPTMNVSEARRQFSNILNTVYRDNTRVVVEKNGIPVAAIVPLEVNDLAEKREANRRELVRFLGRSRSAFEDASDEEIEREIELARADIKREKLLARRIVEAIRRESPDAFGASDESLRAMIADALAAEEVRRVVAEDGGEGYRT